MPRGHQRGLRISIYRYSTGGPSGFYLNPPLRILLQVPAESHGAHRATAGLRTNIGSISPSPFPPADW